MKNLLLIALSLTFLVLTACVPVAFGQLDPLSGARKAPPVTRDSYIEFATFNAPNQRLKRTFSIPIQLDQLKICMNLSEDSAAGGIASTTESHDEMSRRGRYQPTFFGGTCSGFVVHGNIDLPTQARSLYGSEGNGSQGKLPDLVPALQIRSLPPSTISQETASNYQPFQIPDTLMDAAATWIKKVTEAHEKVAHDLPLESMIPFSLANEIRLTKKRFLEPEAFAPPTKSIPPVHFTIYVQPEDVNTLAISKIYRIVVIASPSPLSVRAIRKQLGKPSVMIDESGTRPMNVIEPSIVGDVAFTNQFMAHEQSTEPSTSDYLKTLGTGTEEEVESVSAKMKQKWNTFATQRSEIKVTNDMLLNSNMDKRPPQFLYEESENGGRGGIVTRYRDRAKEDEKQRKALSKRVLQDRLYQSLSRFFGGTRAPAQELIELQNNLRWIKQDIPSDMVSALFSHDLDNRAVLAFDSNDVYFLQATKAAMLVKELLDSNELSLDPILKEEPNRKTHGRDQGRNAFQDQRDSMQSNEERREAELIEEACMFLREYDPTQTKPQLPFSPADPSIWRGRRLSVGSIAIELLDKPTTTGEIIAHGSIVTAIYAISSDNDRLLNSQPYEVIKTARLFLGLAAKHPAYLQNTADIEQFEQSRKSPNFRNGKEYQEFLTAYQRWEAECAKIQTEWDTKMSDLKANIAGRRSIATKYLQSLSDHGDAFDKLEKSENKKEASSRLESLQRAHNATEGVLCFVPSVFEIQKSIVLRFTWK